MLRRTILLKGGRLATLVLFIIQVSIKKTYSQITEITRAHIDDDKFLEGNAKKFNVCDTKNTA